jgi:hypothetical protein
MFTRGIPGCSFAGSEAAMDAWVGRMPWAMLFGLYFAVTAHAGPHSLPTTAGIQQAQAGPAVSSRPETALKFAAGKKPVAAVQSPRAAAPQEPAPPPDLPPPESAPAGAGFVVPAIGDVYVPEAPVIPETPLGLAPAKAIEQHEASEEDDSLIIDQTWRGGDLGLASLCGLPGITSLTIKNAPLTDAALDYIAAIPNLKTLDIEGTPFSYRALARFRLQRPGAFVIARGNSALGSSSGDDERPSSRALRR